MDNKLVPFGKYKDQPIEVLANDKSYLDWLTQQSWFKDRYSNLYQIIINNFSEPTNTPEHNKLQGLFLDDAFCERFYKKVCNKKNLDGYKFIKNFDPESVIPEIKVHETAFLLSQIDGYKKDVEESQSSLIRVGGSIPLWDQEKHNKLVDRKNEYIEKINTSLKICKSFNYAELFECNSIQIWKRFEVQGVDVSLTIQYSITFNTEKVDGFGRKEALESYFNAQKEFISSTQYYDNNKYIDDSFIIEVKPTVSDDYPEILRQMKRKWQSDCKLILFLSEYTGVGLSKDNFIKLFNNENIKIIFESEII